MTKTTISLIAAAVLLHANEPYEITITSATNSEQSIKDVTSNVEVITGAELEEKHITTVLDALRLSGVSISQSGGIGQTSSFFMNGMSSGNTLVLIDGVKYNDPTGTEGQAQLEHLMISDIEQIEIIKGAQSGIWGANAVAGVINIITKKASKELTINTNIEYGTYNTKKVGVNISQKLNNLSYFLGANYIKTDGISAQTPNGKDPSDYEDDGYRNKTINAKIGYEITDKDELKFNITDIYGKGRIDRTTPNDILDEVTQQNKLYKILFTHNFNDRSYLNGSYSKTNFKKEDPYVPMFWGQAIIKGNNQELALDGKIAYSNDSFLLAGIVNQKSEDEINNKEIKSTGYYLTNSNTFDRFIVTESLRYDNYTLFDNKTTGKIGAKYSFVDDIALSGNYGTAYKTPSLYQLYTPTYGNSNLKPETTKSTDVTLSYKHIKATCFYNEITDLIGSDSNYNYTQVEGISKIKGYEINYQDEVVSNLLVVVNYQRQSAKDKDGKDLVRRVKQSAKVNLDYYGIEKLHLGFGANYIGKREDLGNVETGKYTLFNAVANYNVSKNLKTYLKIDNLTDRLYQEVYGYGTSGRAVYVGLNATF